MISDSSKLIQKVSTGNNRGAGVIFWNLNGGGEGVIVFRYISSQGMTARHLISRAYNDSALPKLYYDGAGTIAIQLSEAWASWVVMTSSTAMPPKGTVDSDLTGFTEVTIQQ